MGVTGRAEVACLPFARRLAAPDPALRVIGRGGEIGGKARGLGFLAELLAERAPGGTVAGLPVEIPPLVVLTTRLFDAFMEANELWSVVERAPADDRIAHAFRRAALPSIFAGDLHALATSTQVPLALRSSSLLEDALQHPFAGVYGTKMVPGHEPDAQSRFRALADAVKFVLATTFFADARRYRTRVEREDLTRVEREDLTRVEREDLTRVEREDQSEKMAVVIQAVVGTRHHRRFYPTVSGVARTWNAWPAGGADPEDGVVHLALGLGKTIVDGDRTWWYCPRRPRSPPPFNDVGQMLRETQRRFWAVRMARPPNPDPLAEDEHLVSCSLEDAHYDGELSTVASTLDRRSGRLLPTTAVEGPRLLDFAPLRVLERLPLVEAVRQVTGMARDALGTDVEMEFAATLSPERPAESRLSLLQVRPMATGGEGVRLEPSDLEGEAVLLSSTRALGEGRTSHIRDVVYLLPDRFDPLATHAMAREVERLDAALQAEGRPYLLVGFGRWGTSDPSYGVPVVWSQIAGARVIVEVDLEGRETEPSQGSHFFHNITAFRVQYLTVPAREPHRPDWAWLAARPQVAATDHVRHVRCEHPLTVLVDGRNRTGVVLRHD